MKTLEEKVKEVMRQNTRTVKRDGKVWRYTVPSPDTYPYQWLWDSCFHAIILSRFDIESAKSEMRSLLSAQFQNGMIPHMIYWERERDVIDFEWGKEDTSSITQPPMIAYAVWRIFEKDRDEEFLSETYRKLFHFYKYFLHDRDPHERHLVGIINPDESGEDNSPRFDSLLDLPPHHEFDRNLETRLQLVEENKKCNFDAPFCMKNFFWVKDVPMNVIMIENLRALAKIARILNYSYDAQYFEHKSDQIVTAMHELMREDGIFYSTYGEHYEKIRVKTWAILSPLFTGMLSQEEAREMIESHLLNPDEFWCEYPVPTVAMNEPSFDVKGFWRGPTWMASNWFIHKGLMHYGFTEVADGLKQKSAELLEKSGFREQFDPRTGEGYGAKDFTWGGLILDME